jgi:hypothetical protein
MDTKSRAVSAPTFTKWSAAAFSHTTVASVSVVRTLSQCTLGSWLLAALAIIPPPAAAALFRDRGWFSSDPPASSKSESE